MRKIRLFAFYLALPLVCMLCSANGGAVDRNPDNGTLINLISKAVSSPKPVDDNANGPVKPTINLASLNNKMAIPIPSILLLLLDDEEISFWKNLFEVIKTFLGSSYTSL